jgi:large subunit ribosomal protein LX
MPKFEVKGTFKNDGEMKPYSKTVEAPSAKLAGEFTLATIGSKHRLQRRYITVDAVQAIDGE